MTSGVLKQVAIHNCFRCAHSTQILGFFLSPKKTFATTEQFRVHLPNNLTSSSTSAYLFSLPQRNETKREHPVSTTERVDMDLEIPM
jgi:hypothetical protein